MTRRRVRSIALAAVALIVGTTFATGAATTAAQAAPATEITIVGNETTPVFDYATAIRERVFIPVPGVDQNLDNVDDVTAIDIIRPSGVDAGVVIPAIIDPGPYYTTVGRTNESEHIADLDNDGLNDVWPGYYDNYFVPRGYAVILADMDGTSNSTGCPMHGGPGDIESMKVVVDWLNGRTPGHDLAGNPVTADWHNGKSAMIGKSYDGSLANGVAATGVAGLTTIVPIDAITDWYQYSRTGGIRHNNNYPSSLASAVTDSADLAACAVTRTNLNNIDGDEDGDINAFWADRNYQTDVGNITASVFAVHGLDDDNVKMDQLGDYWAALTARDVPRKIWLAHTGHVDPFDYRRDVWVDTLHHWFDYWLLGIDNGIMDEPMATVENGPDVWEDYANWPLPGTQDVDVYLSATTAGSAGALLLEPDTTVPTSTFNAPGSVASETSLMATPEGSQTTRLVFLSQPLTTELRVSGTPHIELDASLDQTQSNLAAILVDYGMATRTPRVAEGITTTTTETCWGEDSADDDACYKEVLHRSATSDTWRISRGVLDSSNRDSLISGNATPVVVGTQYDFDWPLEPVDQVIAAGHRIGIVVAGNLSGFTAGAPSHATNITVDTTISHVVLPIVGGLPAATAAVGLGAPAPVTLSFDGGGHGATIPGQTVAYNAAPIPPTAPSETGWVFGGWFTDAAHTTVFDFTAAMTADAIAYAKWTDLLDLIDTLQIVPSDATPDQGDTITVDVTGFDSGGGSLGDVTTYATITSDVTTDIVAGNQVTFVHASPHTLTATIGASSATVLVSVTAAAVPTTPTIGGLSFTGATTVIPMATLAAVLIAGGALFFVARRRRRAAHRA